MEPTTFINYCDTPDWHLAVKEITKGRGADHVIDVGGAGALEKSLGSVALEGQVAAVGWLSSEKSSIEIRALIGSVVTLRRVALGNRAHFIAMNRAIALSGMRPVIDRVFRFAEAVSAFKYYEQRKYFGKVVVSIP